VSDIPFVNRLGDAIEAAITGPAAAARRRTRVRRRAGLLALAALLLLGAGAGATRLFATPEQLATTSVGCYEGPGLRGSVDIVWAADRSPLEVCAETYRQAGKPVPPLVACDQGGAVAVLPGRGPEACRRRGLAPLPAGYAPAQAKVAKLERDVLALERSADCIPPEELARRVQALLDRSGWTGWTTRLRLDAQQGPCGSVSGIGGSPERTLSGSIDYQARQVDVFGAARRSTEDLLYGPGRLAPALMDESGERCFSLEELRDHVRRRVAATGRSVAFEVGRLPAGQELDGARGQRYQGGCAIVATVAPAGNGRDLIVEIWQ
jgi:hypothetical protein